MADEPGTGPAPRPRRRRTDIDPTFKPPKVANERRRTKSTPKAAAGEGEAATPVSRTPTSAEAPPAPAKAPAATAEARFRVPDGGAGIDQRPAEAASAVESWLPMLEDRSPDPAVCPFLRAVDGTRLAAPVEAPDIANRCAALREAVPQSLRQQELVCLGSAHVNCPRYLRGAAAVTAAPPPVVRPRSSLTPAVLVSLALLIGAFALSVVFVASRGSVDVAAVASGSPTATASAIASTDAVASPAATSSSSAVPTATPAPTPPATSSPPPTVAPSQAATAPPSSGASPSSDRYLLLVPCPDAPDCWIYTVRSGDNLFSIANYFGVDLATVREMNPWVASGLRAGRELRIPTPTR